MSPTVTPRSSSPTSESVASGVTGASGGTSRRSVGGKGGGRHGGVGAQVSTLPPISGRSSVSSGADTRGTGKVAGGGSQLDAAFNLSLGTEPMAGVDPEGHWERDWEDGGFNLPTVVPVNAVGKYRNTALHAACEGGAVDVVRLLLDRGADLHAVNMHHHTPLHLAARYGHVEVIKALLSAAARLGPGSGSAPLAAGSISLRKESRGQGSELQVELEGELEGRPQTASSLSEAVGAPPPLSIPSLGQNNMKGPGAGMTVTFAGSARMEDGPRTTPQAASVTTTPSGASAGAGLGGAAGSSGSGRPPSRGQAPSALPVAGSSDRLGTGTTGINSGSAAQAVPPQVVNLVNQRDKKGNTPLHLAGRMTLNGGTVALLCRAGAVVNSRNNREETPLLLAAGVNSTPVMQALLQQGADVTLADEAGATALHIASANGNLVAVKALLEAGAKVRAADKAGNTAAHRAASSSAPVLEALHQKGAWIEAPNASGATPLHVATQFGRHDVVRYLMASGAYMGTRAVGAPVARNQLPTALSEGVGTLRQFGKRNPLDAASTGTLPSAGFPHPGSKDSDMDSVTGVDTGLRGLDIAALATSSSLGKAVAALREGLAGGSGAQGGHGGTSESSLSGSGGLRGRGGASLHPPTSLSAVDIARQSVGTGGASPSKSPKKWERSNKGTLLAPGVAQVATGTGSTLSLSTTSITGMSGSGSASVHIGLSAKDLVSGPGPGASWPGPAPSSSATGMTRTLDALEREAALVLPDRGFGGAEWSVFDREMAGGSKGLLATAKDLERTAQQKAREEAEAEAERRYREKRTLRNKAAAGAAAH